MIRCLTALLPLLILSCASSPPAPSPSSDFSHFIAAWITGNGATRNFWLSDERHRIERLGITYEEIADKGLLGNVPDAMTHTALQRETLSLQTSVDTLAAPFRRLNLKIDPDGIQYTFYFERQRLISPARYFSRGWEERRSRYLRFRIADLHDFNPYAAAQLDSFVSATMHRLNFDAGQRTQLAREKIDYLLCSTTEQVSQISGVAGRGIYLPSIDAVVTTYNYLPEALARLLINMKLGKAPAHAHPFLQEGLASALGGEGGKAGTVLVNLGAFLELSEFMSYRQILAPGNFDQTDSSIRRPLSAVYNLFLLREWGAEKYLAFYRRHLSVDAGALPEITPADLPPDSLYHRFLNSVAVSSPVRFPRHSPSWPLLVSGHWGEVWDAGDSYFFRVRGSLLLTPENPPDAVFESREFHAMFPDVRYSGQKYFLEVSREELKLFNFYTGTLTAFFSKGLSLEGRELEREAGLFEFALARSLFEEDLPDLLVTQ